MICLEAHPAVVREWQDEDASELCLQANDRRVSRNLRDAFPYPYGIEDAVAFIAMARKKSPPTFFAIEVDRCVAGGIGYTLHRDVERVSAEVGYWIGYEFWGRGIATAALRAITRHAFRAHGEIRRLYAVPFATNPASARVLQKAGYAYEGTMRQAVVKEGQVLDQWMYAIVREDLEDR